MTGQQYTSTGVTITFIKDGKTVTRMIRANMKGTKYVKYNNEWILVSKLKTVEKTVHGGAPLPKDSRYPVCGVSNCCKQSFNKYCGVWGCVSCNIGCGGHKCNICTIQPSDHRARHCPLISQSIYEPVEWQPFKNRCQAKNSDGTYCCKQNFNEYCGVWGCVDCKSPMLRGHTCTYYKCGLTPSDHRKRHCPLKLILATQPTPTAVPARSPPGGLPPIHRPAPAPAATQPTPAAVLARPPPAAVLAQPTPAAVLARPPPAAVLARPPPLPPIHLHAPSRPPPRALLSIDDGSTHISYAVGCYVVQKNASKIEVLVHVRGSSVSNNGLISAPGGLGQGKTDDITLKEEMKEEVTNQKPCNLSWQLFFHYLNTHNNQYYRNYVADYKANPFTILGPDQNNQLEVGRWNGFMRKPEIGKSRHAWLDVNDILAIGKKPPEITGQFYGGLIELDKFLKANPHFLS